MLSDVASIVDGKTVALIGNAQSLYGNPVADEVDGHDVVIRINMGLPKVVGDYAGARTDIWVTAKYWELANPKCQLVVFMKLTQLGDRDWRRFQDGKESRSPAVRWPVSLADECIEFCQCDPGCGLRFLWLLKKKLNPKSVDIYGFDCWKTPNTWGNHRNSPNHNPAQEAKVIKQLCQ